MYPLKMLSCLCILFLSFANSLLCAAVETNSTSGLLGLQIEAHADVWQLREGPNMIFEGSRSDCDSKRLELLVKRHGTGRYNIRCATLGGKQYWADSYLLEGWRIQRHIGTGHYRLLNPADLRYAWGSYEACRTVLALQQQQLQFGNTAGGRAVVILHGIIRSKDSMHNVATTLAQQGYEILNINYPSAHGHLSEFADQVHDILNKRPDINEVSFVTHSMGGLVLRVLLADPDQAWRQTAQLKNAVLIFPPNQGAHKADLWHQKWWFQCVFGPSGDELTSTHVKQLPGMPMHTGIIIGCQDTDTGKSRVIPGDDDGTVGVDECKLDGVSDYAYHRVGHTFGMNNPSVLTDISSYINNGVFTATDIQDNETTKIKH